MNTFFHVLSLSLSDDKGKNPQESGINSVWRQSLFPTVNSAFKRNKSSSFVMKPDLHSQSVFTCSKLTIETLEQGVKYVQS